MIDQNTAETISILQQKCETLYKNTKYSECIDNLEELVSAKKSFYGEESQEYIKSSERLCEVLNLSAMINLQRDKFDITLEYLRKAEMLSHNSLRFKATTYNNLACFYRRTGKLRTAYNYLLMALDIELKIGSMPSLADTHLNLCAVLSQLDKHTQALEHSLLSIVILQDEFLQQTLKSYREQNGQGIKNKNENQGQMTSSSNTTSLDNDNKSKITDDRLAVLAIAYHNLGVELEHLKRYDESMKIYNRALNFASDNLGQNHSLVQNLTRVLQSAFSQLEGNKAQKQNQTNTGFKRNFKDIYKERVLSANVQHSNDLSSHMNSTQKNLPKLTKLEKLNTCVSSNYYKPDNIDIGKSNNINIGNTPKNAKLIKRTMSGHDSIQNDPNKVLNAGQTVRKQQQYFLTGSSRQTPTQGLKSNNQQSFDFSQGNLAATSYGNPKSQQQRNMSANNYHNQNNYTNLRISNNLQEQQQFNNNNISLNKSQTPSHYNNNNNNNFGNSGSSMNNHHNNNYSFDASLQNDVVYNSYNINKNTQNNNGGGVNQNILKLTPNQIGLSNPIINQSLNNFNNINYQNNSITSNSPSVQQNIAFNSRNQDYHQQPSYPVDVQDLQSSYKQF